MGEQIRDLPEWREDQIVGDEPGRVFPDEEKQQRDEERRAQGKDFFRMAFPLMGGERRRGGPRGPRSVRNGLYSLMESRIVESMSRGLACSMDLPFSAPLNLCIRLRISR